jgi:hypothetical protein
MQHNTAKYKVVPTFGGTFTIIQINNNEWEEVSGPYMTEGEAQIDLSLFESGDVKPHRVYNGKSKNKSKALR